MDASSMEDYWNEICILREARLLEEYLDELDDENNQAKSCEDDASGEGERESEWLSETGLGHLSVAFKEGREIDQDALRPTLEGLSQLQALAVSRRIHTLNRTVRKRHKRQPRAKLTQIFPNFENSSTGTRSRSATPDSLDSTPGGSPPPAPNSNSNVVSSSPQQAPIVSSGSSSPSRPFHRAHHKPNLRRTPSAPMSVPTTTNEMMFRGLRNDEIAFDNGESDGIRMLGYQRLGTLQLPRPKPRAPSEHSPTSIKSSSSNLHYKNDTFEDERASLSRSHSSLIDAVAGQSQRAAARALLSDGDLLHPSIGSSHHVSLPHIPSSLHQGSSSHSINTLPVEEQLGRTWLDSLEIEDIIRLRPLVLLEVTGLFESHNIPFNKRKARKRSRIKNEFNVFGHPISALIEKDIQNGVDPLPVPRVFHEMLTYLEREGLEEEGLLRVSGPKQRVESLRLRVDASFGAAHSFDGTSPHDVATLLKRWLRELPQPLLTEDYMQMFYLVNEMPNTVRDVALNLLVLLLPVEHSATLRRLFDFLHRVASYEGINRMALRNIAIVLAPNIFHPRFVRQLSKQSPNEQAEAATICCQLIERMLNCQDDLWRVPGHLLSQLRRQNEIEAYRRGHKENATAMQRLLGRRLREPITRKIINEVDFQEGVIRISAKELGMSERAFKLTPSLTAGDLVLNLLEETAVSRKSYEKQSSRFHKKNATPATGSPPCLHARTETQLATHCLYEVGGNINRRRLEHSAIVMAVYKENPNAQWALQCHHAMQREP